MVTLEEVSTPLGSLTYMKAAACLMGLDTFAELCSAGSSLVWAECSMLELEWQIVLENVTGNHQMLSG